LSLTVNTKVVCVPALISVGSALKSTLKAFAESLVILSVAALFVTTALLLLTVSVTIAPLSQAAKKTAKIGKPKLKKIILLIILFPRYL